VHGAGIKAGLYTGLTLVHQAAVFIEDDECGQQIACLQVQSKPRSVKSSSISKSFFSVQSVGHKTD